MCHACSSCLSLRMGPHRMPGSHRGSRRPWRVACCSEATLLTLTSMSSLGWPGLHSHANSHLSRTSMQGPSSGWTPRCGTSAVASMSCTLQSVLGARNCLPRSVQLSHRSVRKICSAGRQMSTSHQPSEPSAATHRDSKQLSTARKTLCCTQRRTFAAGVPSVCQVVGSPGHPLCQQRSVAIITQNTSGDA